MRRLFESPARGTAPAIEQRQPNVIVGCLCSLRRETSPVAVINANIIACITASISASISASITASISDSMMNADLSSIPSK
ncbi:hypothetical protein SAMN02799624_00882 [Paenibacillus sp. UNC496MF]|nr:hypothetical protein SAMN02799624_00882 [Paenibacillus sp. UNC496MF]